MMLITATTVLFPFVKTTLHTLLERIYAWRIRCNNNVIGQSTSKNASDDVMLWLNFAD